MARRILGLRVLALIEDFYVRILSFGKKVALLLQTECRPHALQLNLINKTNTTLRKVVRLFQSVKIIKALEAYHVIET